MLLPYFSLPHLDRRTIVIYLGNNNCARETKTDLHAHLDNGNLRCFLFEWQIHLIYCCYKCKFSALYVMSNSQIFHCTFSMTVIQFLTIQKGFLFRNIYPGGIDIGI